jgi:hypothetical protein
VPPPDESVVIYPDGHDPDEQIACMFRLDCLMDQIEKAAGVPAPGPVPTVPPGPPAEGAGDGAGGGAVVEDGGGAVGEDAVDGGVAEQPVRGGVVEAGAVDAGGVGSRQGLVAVEVEDEVEVGPVAASAAGLFVVQEVPADVGEGVGAAGGGAAGGFAVDIGAAGEAEGGGHSSPVSGPRLASSRHRPANVGDRCRAEDGSGLGSRWAVAHARNHPGPGPRPGPERHR